MKIQNITAREIFDSRGNPTVECELTMEGSPLSFRGSKLLLHHPDS